MVFTKEQADEMEKNMIEKRKTRDVDLERTEKLLGLQNEGLSAIRKYLVTDIDMQVINLRFVNFSIDKKWRYINTLAVRTIEREIDNVIYEDVVGVRYSFSSGEISFIDGMIATFDQLKRKSIV